ncbi:MULTISPECIES: amidase family protein [Paraburkholderia]|uniref:amidase family protein n=1 Tax=Paraburkholderia TaxID=1822464 RepID=UPI00039FB429|nr:MULTISPECIES: amidase family protein [Paraburkholderia]MDH6147601.1 aspartyl-tRNA(Asn)/glutamyl-tRNA(Gln) amidotransferase subunit A [Paraburkholderia sp. WSM4179]
MTTLSFSFAALTAAELGRLLHDRKVDARELTDYFVERIEAGANAGVFTSTSFERARREAAQSAARYRAGQPLGPLDGVPVAWKDLIDIEGLATTAGSSIYRDAQPAPHDAPIVRNLAAAGMVTLGKTNLSEFAYSALGLNPHFGTPLNPRASDVPRVPGGSSSGSAVAVAAGLVPVAIGTDTGGSVRTPAAFNGVVGFKSSERWIDTEDVFPLSRTLDTIGVFAHDVADCYLLDLALRGLKAPSLAPDATPLASLTLVAPENAILDEVEPEVRRNFIASLARAAASGVRVRWQPVPELTQVRELIARHGNIAAAEGYQSHRELLESPRHAQIDVTVYKRMMGGKTMSAEDFDALQRGRVALQRSLWATLGDALLVMPTVPHVAPPIAPLAADPDVFARVNLKTICNTLLGNMLNTCGLALPNGVGAAQMPTSLLLSAPAAHEARLLRAGVALAPIIAGDFP